MNFWDFVILFVFNPEEATYLGLLLQDLGGRQTLFIFGHVEFHVTSMLFSHPFLTWSLLFFDDLV